MVINKQAIHSALSKLALMLVIVGCLRANNVYSASDHSESIMSSGLKRTYFIHIPPSSNESQPRPLVILLHGAGGTGKGMVKLTKGGLNTLSDQDGFIVVYPDGIEKRWNDGREGSRNKANDQNVDDVRFISDLIDKLTEQFNIDPHRVYVSGMSNGAMMSYRLAVELSEKIAAIAPVVGNMPVGLSGVPKRPMSVLIINGLKDPLIPWEGGYVHFRKFKQGKVLSTAETVEFWVKHNQCSPAPFTTYEPDKDPNDGTLVRKEIYGSGLEGTEVILYAVEGGGHTWPGGLQYLPERTIGKTSRDINANEIIWNFFKKQVV